jgi:predicted phosphoribosyltransferase
MGAIASGGVRLLNDEIVDALGIPGPLIDQVARREQAELERREQLYRGNRPLVSLTNKTVILVDDGLATGSTMRAAVAAIRRQQPKGIIVAVPVGAPSTCDEMREVAEDVVCLRTPDPFVAVGLWYRDFGETSDAEVRELLGRTD